MQLYVRICATLGETTSDMSFFTGIYEVTAKWKSVISFFTGIYEVTAKWKSVICIKLNLSTVSQIVLRQLYHMVLNEVEKMLVVLEYDVIGRALSIFKVLQMRTFFRDFSLLPVRMRPYLDIIDVIDFIYFKIFWSSSEKMFGNKLF